MVAKVNPVIVRLSLASEQPVEASVVPGDSCPGVRSDGTSVTLAAGVPAGWSPGLVRPWAGGLVGVAYTTTPRKLGKVYCSNRPSVLFHLAEGAEQWTVITGGEHLHQISDF